MRLTRFKLAFLSYALFDLLIGGHCGGLLPLEQLAAAQTGAPAIGNITSSGTTCSLTSVPTNCVVLQLDGSTGAASIDISGTWAATLQFEAFGGVTWAALNCTPPNSTTAVSSTTANGVWQCNVAGFSSIRIRASAYSSGTAAVVINSAHASAKSGGGAVFASGGTTNNVIPKSNGSSALADSSITDNGTNVTTALPLNLTRAGSATVAMIQFNSSTASGVMWGNANNAVGLEVDATNWVLVANNAGNQLQLPSTGIFGWSSSTTFAGSNSDAAERRIGAASIGQGFANSATPIAQTYTLGESSRGGTDSNVAGASGTLKPGIGTGNGAGTKLCIQRDIMGATGSVAQATIDGYCVGPSKTLSNTSATAQSLVNISVPSNSAGGVEGTITVTCTDGTNFDSETQSFNTSFVNKATVLTVTAPVITATSAANNSGSCTAGITAVAGTNSVDIKVTPVFTTIVPTTVTSYIALRNNGTGNATFN